MWDQALRIAGVLGLGGVTIAGAVAVAYALFKHLGSKWLDAKFAERLVDYQHRQNQEIERLRGEIARLLDRTTRLHSQEFEVLPKAWELLGHTVGSVGTCVSALKSYADVTWLNGAELERVLNNQPKMAEFEKETVRELEGQARQKKFGEIQDEHQFRQASDDLMAFHNYIVTKGIFLEPVLSAQFDELSNALWRVLQDYRFRQFEGSTTPTWTEIRDGWTKADEKRASLKEAVISRLWAANQATVDV
ncbi:hypothetical protein [Brevundimonas sp.]|uniref:hypothetical protein n=1 Tax=Brevundimonas sp. TaxID=1871086 RepID=UPI0028A27193|nr:hypothetical protein [Brevundimonas sp.]